ncbi:MAG: dihydropteroate synthase [Firmicutes bacterium]|jgi:5-methyltetrahydrofolate--homocysteine methyltransferase|nr:dihydropteroate synthase [Bacillota bacterium]
MLVERYLVRRDARAQVAAGADVLGINVEIPAPSRGFVDESGLMLQAVAMVQEHTDAPICLDSCAPEVLEAGLRTYVGRALVNSFSLEIGRAEIILPLVARYGAAVIGLTIDEHGIPDTAERRLNVAHRLVEVAESYGIPVAMFL